MATTYAYTPHLLPSLCTVLFLILLSIHSGCRRKAPSALPFLFGCVFATLWAIGSLLEYTVTDVTTKIFWFKFESVWRLPAITASLCFAMEYVWPGRWLTRWNLALLSIPCLLVMGLILTNDIHHLVWNSFALRGIGMVPLHSKFDWIYCAYEYGLGLINLAIFAWLFIRSSQHRWPVSIMMVGQILGRGFYLLGVIQIYDITEHINLSPIAFEYLLYAIALFGFRFLDPIPLAHRAAIEQMHAGMLVLDSQGRIISLNPAAERILAATAKQLIDQPFRDFLPVSHAGQFIEEVETEIRLPAGKQFRHYTLSVSALTDWPG
jgi:PAS domain-containing protein